MIYLSRRRLMSYWDVVHVQVPGDITGKLWHRYKSQAYSGSIEIKAQPKRPRP